jgi:hypothetical protein
MRAERGGAGAEEPWLAELLRAEADRHSPDLDVVRRRLAQEPPPRRRRGGAVWAVAGVLVTVAAGGFAVAGITDLVAASGHTGEVRVVPATPLPATTPPVGETPSAPPSAPPSAASSAATRSAPESRLTVRPAVAGQRVSLAGATDWVVAGGRPDGTAVRRLAGGQALGGPHLVGDPRVAVVAGPFRTSWTGGLPDATGSGVGTWLTVRGRPGGPRTGFLVSAPADASSLTLYAGAGATGARVTVLVDGRIRDEAELPDTPRGHVVTVDVDGPGRVEVRVDTAGDGTVALAAAVAR